MASMVFGSKVFADLFGQAAMRHVFSDASTLQGYLDVEAALARVQAGPGIIPAGAADAIDRRACIGEIDCDERARRARIVGYPILPLFDRAAYLGTAPQMVRCLLQRRGAAGG